MWLFSHPWIRKKKNSCNSICFPLREPTGMTYLHSLSPFLNFLLTFPLVYISGKTALKKFMNILFYGTSLLVSPFSSRQIFQSLKKAYFFTSPKILLFFPHESPTMPISPWLYLAGVCYLQPRNISNRLLSTMYPKHPNLLRPKKANSYYQNLNHKWQ